MAYKNKTIAMLKKDLEAFDKIILMDVRPEKRQLAELFYESEALQATREKILILSGGEEMRRDNVIWRHATESVMNDLLKIYHMYEFSNRFSLFSQEDGFGGLYNLVKTGILTEEEAITAFLR